MIHFCCFPNLFLQSDTIYSTSLLFCFQRTFKIYFVCFTNPGQNAGGQNAGPNCIGGQNAGQFWGRVDNMPGSEIF